MKNIDKDYKLIPMNEITDEAREIAKRWYDGVCDLNDIMEKHKLASDIMNYAMRHPPTHATDEGWGIQYWQRRCKAAEVLIKKYYKNIPDCSEYQDWQDTIDPSPPQQSVGDAVAFVEWIKNNAWVWTREIEEGDGWYNDLIEPPKRRIYTTAELYTIAFGQPTVRMDDGWISVEDRLPEESQIVDIWEMPRTQLLERALSLKGTSYANQYYHDTDYYGWRSTNYKFSIEKDDEGVINCFTKCNPRYFTIPPGGWEYKKICVENGEVTHWRPLPQPPGAQPQPAPRTFSVEEAVKIAKDILNGDYIHTCKSINDISDCLKQYFLNQFGIDITNYKK